ncbi:MAG: single-stranded DNA-binding protein [Planctomycetes bacterium]|nr:single-stranded DNA-binding protein [Planctomycetota bacterium]
MNVLTLVGNVGGEVEVQTVGETSLAKVSLATTDGWGERKKTNWHNLEVWGKSAEAMAQYVTKGAKIAVTGSVDYHSWDKDDGTKGYKTIVKVTNWEFAGSKGDTDGDSTPPQQKPKADAMPWDK